MKAMAEEKQSHMIKYHEKQLMPPRPYFVEELANSGGGLQFSYGKRPKRHSNGLNSGLAGVSTDVTVSEFDSNNVQ